MTIFTAPIAVRSLTLASWASCASRILTEAGIGTASRLIEVLHTVSRSVTIILSDLRTRAALGAASS